MHETIRGTSDLSFQLTLIARRGILKLQLAHEHEVFVDLIKQQLTEVLELFCSPASSLEGDAWMHCRSFLIISEKLIDLVFNICNL